MAGDRETFGTDLKLKFDWLGADLTVMEGDYDTISAEDNLAQAIIARLSTDEGELQDIGHADYGSRLPELVGEPNSERTRQRVENLVRDCLTQDTRIKEVTSVNVRPSPNDPHGVDIEITVLPIESNTFLTVVYPFRLEVG